MSKRSRKRIAEVRGVCEEGVTVVVGAIDTTAAARGQLPVEGCAMLWLHLRAAVSGRNGCDHVV